MKANRRCKGYDLMRGVRFTFFCSPDPMRMARMALLKLIIFLILILTPLVFQSESRNVFQEHSPAQPYRACSAGHPRPSLSLSSSPIQHTTPTLLLSYIALYSHFERWFTDVEALQNECPSPWVGIKHHAAPARSK